MANKKNKVKFGLTNVHYAKINDWVTDASGANLTPSMWIRCVCRCGFHFH